MILTAILTPTGLHIKAQGRRRRTLGTGCGTPREARRGSTWGRVPVRTTRFGVAGLWNPVGVRRIQLEHDMKGCSSAPRVRFATLGFDVQRLRRKETGIDRYPYPEGEDRRRAVPSAPTWEVIPGAFLSRSSDRQPLESEIGNLLRLLAEHHRRHPLTRPSATLSPAGRGKDERAHGFLTSTGEGQTRRPRPFWGEGWGEGADRGVRRLAPRNQVVIGEKSPIFPGTSEVSP